MSSDSSNRSEPGPSPPAARPWPQYRSAHRRKSHDSAHADDADASTDFSGQTAFYHAEVFAGDPTLITTPSALSSLIQHVRSIGSFGYDSEFIGEQSYFPKLCLVQVATTEQVVLIDPIAAGDESPLDLTAFWEVVADDSVQKIVHAGMPDLEPVARHLNRPPRQIFDTQVAAGFAGFDYPMSLGNLLRELTGVDLVESNRKMKFSQWDHRPLSPSQIRYAASDVRFLPLMHRLLRDKIASLGNDRWAAEEMQAFANIELYITDPLNQRVRVRGVDRLSKRKKAVLQALLAWRDAAARTHNVPTRSFLRDDVLFALANDPVQSKRELKQVTGLPRPLEKEYGETIIEITRAALEESAANNDVSPNDAPPQRQHPNAREREEHRARVDELWNLIQQRCADRHLHPNVVSSKREVDDLLYRVLTGRSVAADSSASIMRGWRRVLLGDLVELFLAGSTPQNQPPRDT